MIDDNRIKFIDEFIRIMSEIESELDGGNDFDDDPIPMALWDLRDKMIETNAMVAIAQESK